MTQRDEKKPILAGPPIVGPKEYVVKGPSGWPEIYSRIEADAMLIGFLKEFPLQLAISTFLDTNKTGVLLENIQSHLCLVGKINDAALLTLPIIVSFWAKILEAKRLARFQTEN